MENQWKSFVFSRWASHDGGRIVNVLDTLHTTLVESDAPTVSHNFCHTACQLLVLFREYPFSESGRAHFDAYTCCLTHKGGAGDRSPWRSSAVARGHREREPGGVCWECWGVSVTVCREVRVAT